LSLPKNRCHDQRKTCQTYPSFFHHIILVLIIAMMVSLIIPFL